MTIKLTIEGPGAVEATEELFAMPELQGQWETVGEGDRDLSLATIATIVGIVGGTVGAAASAAGAAKTSLEIAEKIHGWFQKWQTQQTKPVEKVILILPNGQRVNLRRVSVPEIERGLRLVG